MKAFAPRPNLLAPALLVAAISLPGCVSQTGNPVDEVHTAIATDRAARIVIREAREIEVREARARAEKEKTERTLRQARTRQRLAAQEFQERSGGESGGGGNSGH